MRNSRCAGGTACATTRVPLFQRWGRRFRLPVFFALASVTSFGQPGQPAPVQPSLSMQDTNLKPALPGALEGVGIDQNLNGQLPLNLTFRDEAGRSVPLSSFFLTKKPVILALVYYLTLGRSPKLAANIPDRERWVPITGENAYPVSQEIMFPIHQPFANFETKPSDLMLGK